jgi:hypothetical protein
VGLKKGIAEGSSTKAHLLNEYLENLKARVYQYQRQFENEDQIVSATAIKDLLQNKGRSNKNVIAAFSWHNTQCR